MKIKFINGSLFIISIILTLFLSEVMSRLVLNPANYLNSALVKDDTLGHRIPNDAIGYDKWGFRNDYVPDSTDIVAIGDSQTFGINASIGSNWPEQLEDMSDKDVYNLSLKGYGPAQYFYLFKTKVLKLNPEQVVIGYYIGNDPIDTFELVYTNKAWAKLRNTGFSSWLTTTKDDTLNYYLTADLFHSPTKKLVNNLHAWLSGKSILYRLLSSEASKIKHQINSVLEANSKSQTYTNLALPEKNINEGFRPIRRAFKMEISNKKVQEGLRLTLQLFEKMNERSKKEDIKFTVLLIPTKEMVFCHYLFNNHKISHSKAINNLLNNERIIREISIKYFMSHNINFIDALPLMQQKIDTKKLYPPADNDHPNDNGYYLIAKSVFDKMQLKTLATK